MLVALIKANFDKRLHDGNEAEAITLRESQKAVGTLPLRSRSEKASWGGPRRAARRKSIQTLPIFFKAS